jgi:enterochelin esterase-like enzyme
MFVIAALLFSIGAFAQGTGTTPPPPPLMSHQVNADRTITFRYAAPSASKVLVSIDAYPKPLPMTKDAAGIWSVTTAVLPPEYYGYGFTEDGVEKLDPMNSDTLQNYVSLGDSVLIPGQPAEPWELTSIPHGRVDHTFYTTHVAKHLPENQEPYVVYTPPGYDPKHKGGYPVLYLLHGWSDKETAWTANGHADLILDRLMAEGKAVPMILVMPQGYGDLDFVEQGFGVWGNRAKITGNLEPYSKMLLTEIIPAVEREYDVAPGRENRAISGLSMGGLESLTIGLNHPEEFAYVGGMSSAIFGRDKAGDATSAKLRLLWVGCGKADGLIRANRDFVAWTKAKGFDTVAVETEGAHTWLTWRDNLVQLAPLLFRGK